MGFFSSSPSTTPAANTNASVSAHEAPDRTKRARCWDSRDAYFGCLDKNNILDALKESDKAGDVCGAESQGFERDCVASWVKYFKQRRVAEFQKEEMLRKQEAETRR